jgi:hypothetical protein
MTVADLAVPDLGPEVLAKMNGSCPLCPEPILAGESYIRKAGSLGFVHAICAIGYVHVLEEHDYDGANGASEES